jgi:peptide/nickel transport system substrate-binding protein
VVTLSPITTLAQSEIVCESDVVVQADDWLSKIADKFYGNALAYAVVAEATNAKAAADNSYARIVDVDVIEPGWKLCIPSAADVQAMQGEAPAATGTGEEKVLRFALPGLPPVPDPHVNTDWNHMIVHETMFEPLINLELNNGRLELAPALAESWQQVDDTTWEFKLRQGVSFHNGEPFNADSVVYSINRILNPPEGELRSPVWRAPNLNGVEKVDDFTVRITTKVPDATLPRGLSWWLMVPPNYIEEVGVEGFRENLVGTGPFKLESWEPANQVVVVANENYWQGRPRLNRVILRDIPDAFTRASALQAGEIDMAMNIPIDLVEQLESSNLAVQSVNLGSAMVLQFDIYEPCTPEAICDQRVRQALNYAIDKEAIVRDLFKGYGAVSPGQQCPPEAFGYCPQVEAYPYDPERAKALLAEAGYADGFDMTISATSGYFQYDNELAQAISDQLSRVGVNVTIETLEAVAWLGIIEGRLENYHARGPYLLPWNTYGDCAFALEWGTERAGPYSYTPNEAWTQAVYQARETFVPEERERLYCEAAQIQKEEVPMVFLVQPPFLVGYNPRVQNFTIRPDQEVFFFPLDVSN